MDRSLYTVTPLRQNADILNNIVKEIICGKLKSIITQISEQLNLDLNFELAQLRHYHNGIINPSLFYYYFYLKDVISSGNLNDILDVVNLIFNQPIIIKNMLGVPTIGSVISDQWEQALFNTKARRDPVSDFGVKNNFEIIQPVFHKNLCEQERSIKEALLILKNTDSEHCYSAAQYLNEIKVFEGTVRGFSYQAAYGNIYIRIPTATDIPVPYYLEHIVHECAHQHLFALQLIDPVVLNDKDELFDAPIRIQKRPMDGIFHACFVLARMVRCFRRTELYFDKSKNQMFLNKIDSWFIKSYRIVKEYAKLTDAGAHLFKTFKECAYE